MVGWADGHVKVHKLALVQQGQHPAKVTEYITDAPLCHFRVNHDICLRLQWLPCCDCVTGGHCMRCIVTSRAWRDPAPGVEGGHLLPIGRHDAAAGAQLLGRQRLKLHLACPGAPAAEVRSEKQPAPLARQGSACGRALLEPQSRRACTAGCRLVLALPGGVGTQRSSPRLTTCAIHQGSRRGSSGSVGRTSLAMALFTRHTCARGPAPGTVCHPTGCQQSVFVSRLCTCIRRLTSHVQAHQLASFALVHEVDVLITPNAHHMHNVSRLRGHHASLLAASSHLAAVHVLQGHMIYDACTVVVDLP